MRGMQCSFVFNTAKGCEYFLRSDVSDGFISQPWKDIEFQSLQYIVGMAFRPDMGLFLMPFSGQGLKGIPGFSSSASF